MPKQQDQEEIFEENDRQWKQFLRDNPEYQDSSSEHRKLGDSIFVKRYAANVSNGKLEYAKALELIDREVIEQLGTDETGIRRREIRDMMRERQHS